MKIVVFGPYKRVGALEGDQVVDLSGAFAKYLKERDNEAHASEVAAALVPRDLTGFIEAGRRALDHSQKALEYVLKQAGDLYDALVAHRNGLPAPSLLN